MRAVIRKAYETDAERVGEIHYKAWMETYTGLLPERFLACQSIEKRIAAFRKSKCSNLFVAEVDGDIVGFCGYGEFREPADGRPMGEIQGIYLLDAYKRIHLGQKMMELAVEQLRNCGFRTVGLWVLKTNENAIRFYEKLGFQHDGIIREADLDGPVTELLYTKGIA